MKLPSLIRGFIFLCLIPLATLAATTTEEPYADKYELIKPPYPPANREKVEVVEIFLYTCPHCYAFEPHLKRWLQTLPKDLDFSQVPAVFGERGILLAKAHYAAEALGILEPVHQALYQAIHDQNRDMNSEQVLMRLFAQFKVSEADFRNTFNSFSVDTKVRRAKLLTTNYGISGVPSIVINGKYRLSSGQAGGYAKMFEVINYLIQKERASSPTTLPTKVPLGQLSPSK